MCWMNYGKISFYIFIIEIVPKQILKLYIRAYFIMEHVVYKQNAAWCSELHYQSSYSLSKMNTICSAQPSCSYHKGVQTNTASMFIYILHE